MIIQEIPIKLTPEQIELKDNLSSKDVINEPKFFIKMSNSYFMSANKYASYFKGFLFKSRKKLKS